SAAARFTMSNKIVSDLGSDDNFVALFWERFRDQLFTEPIAIGIGGIAKRDAQIERLVHERDRFALRKLSPPTGRDCPEPKSDFADTEVGVFVSTEAHWARLTSNVKAFNVQRPRGCRSRF